MVFVNVYEMRVRALYPYAQRLSRKPYSKNDQKHSRSGRLKPQYGRADKSFMQHGNANISYKIQILKLMQVCIFANGNSKRN